MFNDIREVHEKGDDASHFMATVVCLQRKIVPLGTDLFSKLDIVDGQQRITTLIILLKALHLALDVEKRKQRRLAEELAALLVKEDDNLLLLQTNHDTSHYFANYIRNGTAPGPSEAKMAADKELLSAIRECEEFVEDWKEGGTLTDLATLIKNRLSFILHEVSDEKLVYTVFEVLNSRGMEVVWLDRLKSILMGLAFSSQEATRDDLIKELRTIWRDIYATIGLRQDLNKEALRFAATLYSKVQQGKPLDEKRAVHSLRERATNAKEIRKIAQWILKVTRAWDEIMSNPRRSAVTRITQARLLAVAIQCKEFKEDDRERLLECWERVSFRIFGLSKEDARFGVGGYCNLAWDVVQTDLSLDKIVERILELGSDYPIKQAIQRLRGVDRYKRWTDELRYIFFRYEEHLARMEGSEVANIKWEHVWANNASQSIEHIRPQSEAPEGVRHTLGNLMLLPPRLNSRLQDKLPRKKVDKYRGTGFLHVMEVADMLQESPGWSKNTCRARERALLEWIEEEWGEC